MQALILAGGEGTRLRPLTSTVPKPVVPLVDRPFIAFMLDWLRGARRRRRRDVLRASGRRRARRARRRLVGRRAAALHGGAAAAGHRRRAEVRRGPARRALPDAQRRHADRPRPVGADRGARGVRGAGDAGAVPGRGPVRLRAGAAGRRRRRCGVRREAGAGPDRHATTSPRACTCSSGRCWTLLEHGCAGLDRARRLPARWSATGCTGTSARATGRTSGRPSATWRRRSTSSRAPSRHRGGRAHGRRLSCASRTGSASTGRIVPSALVEGGCRIGAGARIGGRAVLEHGVVVGEGTTIESAVVMAGATIGAHCTLRGCIVAAGARSATTA